ncbi:hypothetical protein BL254_20270 [Protofrankia sp. BMG5.30]|uniref:Uncharacterized protein n=1 Tax=Protofrankia coriariae TaxID=1562887 RepID=A0ABR5EZU6_9ACTN|nr:hypothetical protein FrCorBMG51_21035 [Protofrankia coriariae]ONH33292.1 hypothetical protein BL254_20270 [Protofrankia sp. BMG5.30]
MADHGVTRRRPGSVPRGGRPGAGSVGPAQLKAAGSWKNLVADVRARLPDPLSAAGCAGSS